MIKQISVVLLIIVLGIVAMATLQPSTFSVRRVVSIKATPDKIAPLISDFHQWAAWSPWEHLDPAMQRTFEGAPSGKGAIYRWTGNKQVGAGRMEITDLSAVAKVVIKLDFLEPFESHNVTTFSLEPQGEMTTVSWDMTGPMPFMSKLMTVFVSMDSMIGKDFEKGLANLKTVAEK
jgi:hypothetical protein